MRGPKFRGASSRSVSISRNLSPTKLNITSGGSLRRFVSCSAVAVSLVVVRAEVSANQFDDTIVTATRTPTPLEDIGNAVSVITRQQIVASQARTLGDVLRRAPGLSVVQSGKPGGQTSVFLRGLNSNQTLFLIDGARINNPLSGLVVLSSFTPDEIERIEIVRGPQSTLYGADALGGVINIITRKGEGKINGSVSAEAGSDDAYRVAGEVSGGGKLFGGSLSIAQWSTDNVAPNEDYENFTVGGAATFRPMENFTLGAVVRFTRAESGIPGPVAVRPPNLRERLEDQTLFARVSLDLTLYEVWHQTLFVAETHEELFDRGEPFAVSDSRSDVLQVGWQHTLKLARHNTLTAGVDWYVNRGEYETVGATPFDESVTNTAVYLQDQATLFDRLSITLGGRYNEHSQFDGRFTWRGAAVLRIDETGTRLKASGGTGFKAPSLSDLFLSFPSPPPFASFVANPDLKPEKSTGWDAGFEQDFGKWATLDVRYFENRVRDLITFGFVAPDFTQINVERAKASGIEASLEVRPCADLTLWASYTWLAEADNVTTQTKLLRRPEHTATVGANYRLWERYNFHTQVTLVGNREDIDPVSFGRVENGRYAKWDVALSADVHEHLRVFGRVENLLDEDYEEASGFPALGRVFWGGLAVKF